MESTRGQLLPTPGPTAIQSRARTKFLLPQTAPIGSYRLFLYPYTCGFRFIHFFVYATSLSNYCSEFDRLMCMLLSRHINTTHNHSETLQHSETTEYGFRVISLHCHKIGSGLCIARSSCLVKKPNAMELKHGGIIRSREAIFRFRFASAISIFAHSHFSLFTSPPDSFVLFMFRWIVPSNKFAHLSQVYGAVISSLALDPFLPDFSATLQTHSGSNRRHTCDGDWVSRFVP